MYLDSVNQELWLLPAEESMTSQASPKNIGPVVQSKSLEKDAVSALIKQTQCSWGPGVPKLDMGSTICAMASF